MGCSVSTPFYSAEFHSARLKLILLYLKEAYKEDLRHRLRHRRVRRAWYLGHLRREKNFVQKYRLNRKTLKVLEEDILPLLPVDSRRGFSHRTKILCALSFLARGCGQKAISSTVDAFSQPSTSRAIRVVVSAISDPRVVAKYVKFPNGAEERAAVKQRFNAKFKLRDALGCVCWFPVCVVRPKQNEDEYHSRGRHNTNVANVVIVTDADGNIMYVDVKYGGANDCSVMFEDSAIKRHLEALNDTGDSAYLLGDSDFILQDYLMTPYRAPQPNSPEQYYNYLHTAAMASCQTTLRNLKSRFQCLLAHVKSHYDLNMVSNIVVACCVLHNICNQAGLEVPILSDDVWRKEGEVLDVLRGRRVVCEGRGEGRDWLVQKLWNEWTD